MLQIMKNSIQYKADKNASLTIYNVLGEVISRFTCEGNGVSPKHSSSRRLDFEEAIIS